MGTATSTPARQALVAEAVAFAAGQVGASLPAWAAVRSHPDRDWLPLVVQRAVARRERAVGGPLVPFDHPALVAPELWWPLPLHGTGAEERLVAVADMAHVGVCTTDPAALASVHWTAAVRPRAAALLWDAVALLDGTGAGACRRLSPWLAWIDDALDRAERNRAAGVLGLAAVAPDMPRLPELWRRSQRDAAVAYQWLLGRGIRLEAVLARGTYGAVCRATVDGVAVRAVKVTAEAIEESGFATELEAGQVVAAGDAPDCDRDRVVRFERALRIEFTGALDLRVGALVMGEARASLPVYDQRVLRPGDDCGRRLGLLADVYMGLRAVHRAGMAVCDLKPDNVLVFDVPNTTSVVARLADFGINRPLNDGGDPALPPPCRGTQGWNSVARDIDSTYRPATRSFDLSVFAKVCVHLLRGFFAPDPSGWEAARQVTTRTPWFAAALATPPSAWHTLSVAGLDGLGGCAAASPDALALLRWAAAVLQRTNDAAAALARPTAGTARGRYEPAFWDTETPGVDPDAVPDGLAPYVLARERAAPQPVADEPTAVDAFPPLVRGASPDLESLVGDPGWPPSPGWQSPGSGDGDSEHPQPNRQRGPPRETPPGTPDWKRPRRDSP